VPPPWIACARLVSCPSLDALHTMTSRTFAEQIEHDWQILLPDMLEIAWTQGTGPTAAAEKKPPATKAKTDAALQKRARLAGSTRSTRSTSLTRSARRAAVPAAVPAPKVSPLPLRP